MNLIKELENVQAKLKNSDSTDAGNGDATDNTDIEFATLRNNISKPSEITGAAVQDYLEKAAEINDEVDTVVFGLEDDEGGIVKIYVNAEQADEFESKMSELLGMEDDLEAAINKAAETFDIVDVVWPEDAEGEATSDEETPSETDEDDDFDIDSIEGDETPDVQPEDATIRRSTMRSLGMLLSVRVPVFVAALLWGGMTFAADLEKGKEINGTCAACHGDNGQGGKKGEYPRIVGQQVKYLESQLKNFRARTRINIPMLIIPVVGAIPTSHLLRW